MVWVTGCESSVTWNLVGPWVSSHPGHFLIDSFDASIHVGAISDDDDDDNNNNNNNRAV